MVVATALGTGFVVCFVCWIVFVLLYCRKKKVVEMLSKMKFKLSDENLDQTSMDEVDTSGGRVIKNLHARGKKVANKLVAAASGEFSTTRILHRDVESSSMSSQELYTIG